MDVEAVDDEAQEGAEEASPGCEVEELSSTGHHREQAGGHADSTTEIQDLEINLVMFGILNELSTYNTGKSDCPLFRDDIRQYLLYVCHVKRTIGVVC